MLAAKRAASIMALLHAPQVVEGEEDDDMDAEGGKATTTAAAATTAVATAAAATVTAGTKIMWNYFIRSKTSPCSNVDVSAWDISAKTFSAKVFKSYPLRTSERHSLLRR